MNYKNLTEQYQEEFHRPKGSMRILTKEEAIFMKALWRLNYFKEDKQNGTKSTNTRKTT